MSLKEFTAGQNLLSTELFCVLEWHTHISTCNQTETVVECNPWCVLEQDTQISTCNQIETVVECNPWCVLEQDTHISTCNQTEMVVECNHRCVLEQDTRIYTDNQTESVVEWKPYAQISLNMSSITARVTGDFIYCPDFYHNKIMSYARDMFFYV